MPAPLLYTEIGVVEMCDAHSVFLEFSSLTEDMRATKEYFEMSPLFPFGDPEGAT